MREYAITLLYCLNLALILVLTICYLRGVRGVWPPGSRRMLIAGWTWYGVLYAVALWVYALEIQVKGVTSSLLLAVAAIVLTSLGVALLVWAFKTFSSYARVLGERIDTLITEGPYRYTRNPQYLAVSIILLGLAALHESYAILGFANLQVLTYYLLALLEERELRERFGRTYEKYVASVPRFIPIPHRRRRR